MEMATRWSKDELEERREFAIDLCRQQSHRDYEEATNLLKGEPFSDSKAEGCDELGGAAPLEVFNFRRA